MRPLALFVVLLAFQFAGPSRAQQVSGTTTNDPPSSSAPPPAMTPRQVAETRASILMARKEYSEAAVTYLDILRGDPKNAEVLNKVGIAYQQLGELNRAEHYYKKAISADKKFSSAVNNLGTLDYERKRYSKAIKSYQKALSFGNEMASIYSNLGYAYYANKEYPGAMSSFGKALALDPTIFERKGGVGSILQQRAAPNPGLFFFLLAKSFAKSGDAERTAHYLKLSRDDGYKDFATAEKDPEFAQVIQDPRVQEVLHVVPSYVDDARRPTSN
jgi:tetratricopeptide (TPR) repeat protein